MQMNDKVPKKYRIDFGEEKKLSLSQDNLEQKKP